MKSAVSVRCVFIASAAGAMLAGCGGQAQVTPPSQLLQSVQHPGPSSNVFTRPVRGHAWMDPSAKKKRLLYTTDDSTNDVYVYTYPGGKLVGTLTGFAEPAGECTDKHGNVWIVNLEASNLIEYAHGGTVPIATLGDPNEYPYGCSVDKQTGNLAVSNFEAPGGGYGSLAIYSHASGTPSIYSDSPTLATVRSTCYDDQGNVFVDGTNTSGAFAFAELPAGSGSFTNITLNQSISRAGGVACKGGKSPLEMARMR